MSSQILKMKVSPRRTERVLLHSFRCFRFQKSIGLDFDISLSLPFPHEPPSKVEVELSLGGSFAEENSIALLGKHCPSLTHNVDTTLSLTFNF